VKRLIAGPVVPGLILSHIVPKYSTELAPVAVAGNVDPVEWTPEFLDIHQNESLVALAERMIPGSTQAHVNRFIDLLLTVDTQENKAQFLASLGAFEAESRSRFGHPFPSLTEDQQTQILTAASLMEPGKPPVNENWFWFSVPSRASLEPLQISLRDHFENLKGWITRAYYSSEVGLREIGWTGEYFFEKFPGCEHPDGHSRS
jgi:hypothetical protein